MGLKSSTAYSVEPIGPRTSARSFPLAGVLCPRLTPSEWGELCLGAEARLANPGTTHDGERITVVVDAHRYVKAVCFHALREHALFGRLIDVPLLVIASAADGDGVAMALLDFLAFERDRGACAGIRFWGLDERTWRLRSNRDYIQASDHGLFVAAPASGGEGYARPIDGRFLIDRFSR